MFILYNADVRIAMINLEPSDLAALQEGRVLSWMQGDVRCRGGVQPDHRTNPGAD